MNKERGRCVKCDNCDREESTINAINQGWLIKLDNLDNIVEVYCNVCRVIICPKGVCAD